MNQFQVDHLQMTAIGQVDVGSSIVFSKHHCQINSYTKPTQNAESINNIKECVAVECWGRTIQAH
jgi:hypothetical protein